ncbi:MAG: MerR family transcriptional regulator [Methylococcales bacterium]|nr:MerR family transcriptional regulator [Methylococcales bacterium]
MTLLTGIKPETLRAWEKRYGLIQPVRDANGHRAYHPEDVKRLGLLAHATRQGHAISKLAHLSYHQLESLLEQKAHPGTDFEPLLQQILEALQHYQTRHCEHLLKRAMIAMPAKAYARDILLPLLVRIGDLWHQKRLTITQEHIFSACVKRIVLSMVNNLSPHPGEPRRMLFATLTGEQHEFGILLTCLIAADHGLTCQYVGPDLPAEELIEATRWLKPSHIVLSAVNSDANTPLLDALAMLADTVPQPVELWIGGHASTMLAQQDALPGRWQLITSLDDFDLKLQARPHTSANTLSDY